jgi:hypothetical protein
MVTLSLPKLWRHCLYRNYSDPACTITVGTLSLPYSNCGDPVCTIIEGAPCLYDDYVDPVCKLLWGPCWGIVSRGQRRRRGRDSGRFPQTIDQVCLVSGVLQVSGIPPPPPLPHPLHHTLPSPSPPHPLPLRVQSVLHGDLSTKKASSSRVYKNYFAQTQ